MRSPRFLAALAIFAVGLTIGGVVVARIDSDAAGSPEIQSDDALRAAAANGDGEIVFYSGKDEAGVIEADHASGWEFVDDNDWWGTHWSDWSAGDCKPDSADDFPSDRGLHILAGYSLGRLGPVYFLRSASESRWNEIDTIYLLDPGTFEEMQGGCDRSAGRPSADLYKWLAASSNRNLVIISAEKSRQDDGGGIKAFYLYDFYRGRQDVADRVFYCIDDKTTHKAVVREYIDALSGRGECPLPELNRHDRIKVIEKPEPTRTTEPPPPTTEPTRPPVQPPTTEPAPPPATEPAPPRTTNPVPPTTAPPRPPARRLNPYDNYGGGAVGRAMCRGNPDRPESMPGGKATQTFSIGSGVASIDSAKVQIDPDSRVTAHAALSVNGTVRARADAAAAGDTTFNFGKVGVRAGDQVALSITFTATYGKIITVYTVGNPGGTFSASNSCSDGAPSFTTSSSGLRAVISGWSV